MYLISNIIINTFSVLILLTIYIYSRKYSETQLKQNKIFIQILCLTILFLIVDIFGRLDGHVDTILPVVNKISNFLIYAVSPLIPSLWISYVYHRIHQGKIRNKPLLASIWIINIVNLIMVILTQWYGWFYYIDENNIYHRGSLYMVSTIFIFLLLMTASALIIKNRIKLEHKHFCALLFFCVPPIVTFLLQIIFLGFSFVYNGIALSLFIIFLYVQNQDTFTDYLTDVANRKKLELHLNKMISKSTPNNTFSAIMIDLDNFKKINDTLGHKIGDEVLETAAEIMKNCIGKQDLIARYGGDEFCIVLNTSNINVLKDTVEKIAFHIHEYNASGVRPYELGLSMGYAIYKFGMNVDEFQSMIDKLMYEHKRSDNMI